MVKAYAVNWSEAWPIPDDESKEGHYVKYEDYAALAAECAALKISRGEILKDLDDTCFEIGMMRGEKSACYTDFETPATDRFLAEQRAQGVEKCASVIQQQVWDESEGDGIVAALDAMEIFAAQLRNEVKV